MSRSGLGSKSGRVANPTENLQRTPKFSYIHRDVDCTMGSFTKNKSFFKLGVKKDYGRDISLLIRITALSGDFRDIDYYVDEEHNNLQRLLCEFLCHYEYFKKFPQSSIQSLKLLLFAHVGKQRITVRFWGAIYYLSIYSCLFFYFCHVS